MSFKESNDLKVWILQLEQEKEEVEAFLHKSNFEKNQLKWDLQQQDTKFNVLKEKYDKKKEKVKNTKLLWTKMILDSDPSWTVGGNAYWSR